MAQQLAKKMLGGGEGPENASAIEYLDSLAMGGGEGPETNLFGSEYIVSLAPVGPAAFSGGSSDYGIWTPLPEHMTGVAAVGRKKNAA
jgi:hypothetical protein